MAKQKSVSKATSDTDADEQAKKTEKVIAEIQDKYRSYEPATRNNAYLRKKGVPCVPGLKQDGQDLVVPFFGGKDGSIVSLQHIMPDGKKLIAKGTPFGEGFFTIHGLADAAMNQYALVCEGLATGISLWYSTFSTVIVTGSEDKLSAGIAFAKQHFAENHVICCADNDNDGDENTGFIKAKTASLLHGSLLAVPPADEGKAVDFNDLFQEFGREKVLEVVANATKQSTVKIPAKFQVNSKGLFVNVLKGKELHLEQISDSPLEILGRAVPLDKGKSWALSVRWKDPDGHWQYALLPNDKMATDPKFINSQLGKSYKTYWQRYGSCINEYLAETIVSQRIWLSDRHGWIKDVYLTPNRYFGSSSWPVQTNLDVEEAEYTPKGTLEEFSKLSSLAQGNRIFVLALSAACAAPLLGLANKESGGFHLVGQSSCGKTTALVMATAFWRNPQSMATWNSTANALEFVASKYHDNLLTIDEISQVSSQDLYKSLYTLANGKSKGRMRATKMSGVQEAEQKRWRLLYLSTGEEDIELRLTRDGRTPMAGQEVRLATVPVENGHIRNLHGYQTDTDFLTAVRTLSSSSYGTAGEKFLEYLTAYVQPLREGLPAVISEYENELCAPYIANGHEIDNQVRRVATRFSLCIVGGCLASAWGIINISQDEIVQAMTDAFAAWIDQRGGTEASETKAVVDGMRRLLKKYADNFVVDGATNPSGEPGSIGDIAYRKSISPTRGGIGAYIVTEPGRVGLYVDPDFFKYVLCRELGKKDRTVKTILRDAGYLVPDPSDPKHFGTRFTPYYLHGEATDGRNSKKRYIRLYYRDMFLCKKQSELQPEHSPSDETSKDVTFDI